MDGDGAGPGAEIDCPTITGHKRGGPAGQLFALEPGDVDPRLHVQRVAAERQRAGDPRERFTLFASADPCLEGGAIGSRPEQLVGLLVGGDATGLGQPMDHRARVEGHVQRRRGTP